MPEATRRTGIRCASPEQPALLRHLGGFLLGVAINAATAWWLGEGRRPPRVVEDLRAILSLAAAILLIVLVWNRSFVLFPSAPIDGLFGGWARLGRFGPEHVLAAIVGFYFGSRS